jgi:hypothetical protein
VDFASGWNAIGIAAGDLDGDSRPELVFANAYDDNLTVYRNLTILEPNQPPVARATASPALDFLSDETTFVVVVRPGETPVIFDGSGSTDPDGDPLVYQWSVDGVVFAHGAVSSNMVPLGSYSIELNVWDGSATGIQTITLHVIDGASAVESIIALVEESTLSRRVKRPIIASLKTAAAALTEDRSSAVSQIEIAQAKIERQIGSENPDLAALLNAALQEIIDAISSAP